MRRLEFSGPLVMILMLLSVSSCRTEEAQMNLLPVVSEALYDSSSVWFTSLRSYSSNIEKLPIGIITSGAEELAVVEKFLTADYFDNITGTEEPDGICDFAGEKFYILLDYADSPYNGYYNDSTKLSLFREITIKNCLRIMGGEYYIIPNDKIATGVKDPVKMIVNVSDGVGMFCQNDIDTLLSLSGAPLKALDMVSAGIKAVVSQTADNNGCAIGVLSSYDLYCTGIYESMIRSAMYEAGKTDRVQVFQQLCQGLEEAVEGDVNYVFPMAWCTRIDYRGPVLGTEDDDIDINMMDRYGFDKGNHSLLCTWKGHNCVEIQLNSPGNYARFHLVSLIEKHRRSGSRMPIQAIVLGNMCDSFVLDTLKSVISELYDFHRDGQYIYRNSISPNLMFIDPAEYLVKDCYRSLRKSRKLALNTSRTELTSFMMIPSPSLPSSSIDSVTCSFTDEFKYGRMPGSDAVTEKMVPFSLRYIEPSSFLFTVDLFPESTRQIKKKLY